MFLLYFSFWFLFLKITVLCIDKDAFREAYLECPENRSIYRQNDINRLIYYYVDNNKNVTGAINTKVTTFLDFENNTLSGVLSSFDNIEKAPEKLKDILKDVVTRGNTVRPLLRNIAMKLRDLPAYKNAFIDKFTRYNELERKFQKYRLVCDAFCEEPSTKTPSQLAINYLNSFEANQTADSDFYCISYEDLQVEIANKVKIFVDSYVEELEIEIQNKTIFYNNTYIEDFKQNISNTALNIFSKAMYSVLNLTYQYKQLTEFAEQSNVESAIQDLQDNSLYVDSKLYELARAVERYGKKCKECQNSNLLLKLEFNAIKEEIPERDIPNQESSLFDKVFGGFVNRYKQDIQNTISKAIDDVQSAVNNKAKELLKLQGEEKNVIIASVTATEQQDLENLKKIVPMQSFQELFKLKNDYDLFTKQIKAMLDSIPLKI